MPSKVFDKKKNKNSKLYNFLKLQMLSFVLYLMFFILLSAVFVYADVSADLVYYFSLGTFILLSFIVAFIAGIKVRKNGLITGIICSLPMNIVLVLASAVSNTFKIDLTALISLLLLVLASALGGVVSVNVRLKK